MHPELCETSDGRTLKAWLSLHLSIQNCDFGLTWNSKEFPGTAPRMWFISIISVRWSDFGEDSSWYVHKAQWCYVRNILQNLFSSITSCFIYYFSFHISHVGCLGDLSSYILITIHSFMHSLNQRLLINYPVLGPH